MRSIGKTWCRRVAGAAVVLCCTSVASAQFAGFNVRFINVTSEQVNDHTEALQMAGDPRTTAKAFGASFDGSDNYATINHAGGGSFGSDHDFPGGASGNTDAFDDFILYATAEVTIPEGEWAIGFGTDDGGQLTLEGLDLPCVVGCNEGGELPFDTDQIAYNGNRGHGWTIGELIVDNDETVSFNASMHERGGGDSFEVAIVPLADWNGTGFDINDGWQLLGDGVFDWGVSTEKSGEIAVAGDGLGELFASANEVSLIRGEGGDEYAPGLAQEWSMSGNQGNRQALLQSRFDSGIAPDAFRADDTDWWNGSVGADANFPSYPANIGDAGYGVEDTSNNDNYSVMMTGELLFEADGTYKFRDGVDDYTYMAVDLDRSGVAGDSDGEVLIDDNSWTGVDGVRNGTEGDGPSPLVEVEIDVQNEADGDWIAVEFMMAEGGGGDAGMLYWNGNDLDNELFDEPGLVIDDPGLAVPQTHARSKLPGEVLGLEQVAAIGDGPEYTMQVSSQLLDSDHIVFDGTLDVNGLVINVEADGELVAGDSWVLLIGEEIVGLDTVQFNFDNADNWDLSQLTTNGRIIYTGAAAANSVPEPASFALLGLGGMALGLLRRRRR